MSHAALIVVVTIRRKPIFLLGHLDVPVGHYSVAILVAVLSVPAAHFRVHLVEDRAAMASFILLSDTVTDPHQPCECLFLFTLLALSLRTAASVVAGTGLVVGGDGRLGYSFGGLALSYWDGCLRGSSKRLALSGSFLYCTLRLGCRYRPSKSCLRRPPRARRWREMIHCR